MTMDEMAAIHDAAFAGAAPAPWSAGEIAGALLGTGAFATVRPGIGFAIWRAIAGEGELLTLAVAPGRRRSGYGASLLAEGEARLLGAGARRAVLEVSEANGPARALYAGAGWVQDGRRPGYYRTPDGHRTDALVLAKSLG